MDVIKFLLRRISFWKGGCYMKLWLKRIFVIFVSIVTLGLYIPPMQLHPDAESSNSNKEFEPSNQEPHREAMTVVFEASEETKPLTSSAPLDPIDLLVEQAKAQAITKLGPRIVDRIEDDFTTSILPGIETVLETVFADMSEEELAYLSISEEQTAGYGEKIFDVYDRQTGQDLMRFHVRRDNRPQEGYWFNFHYHMKQDNYETHYTIGEIYWSKNTPPKWMA